MKYLASLAAGAVPASFADSYRDANLKALLRSEAREKCIYCESKFGHVYVGDVEHLLPKSKYPEKRLNYENLGFACYVCNNRKKDFDEPLSPLIDPYVDEPSEHLLALGWYISGRPESSKGYVTEKVLDLNRMELIERRQKHLKSLEKLAELYVSEKSPFKKALLKTEIDTMIQDGAEYAFISRAYVRVAFSRGSSH